MATGKLPRRRILIVDDDAFNREGMRLYLSRQGFDISETGDAHNAKILAAQERPDAAVIDIVIPETADERPQIDSSNGIQLARHLKKLDPALGIVLFSAHEDRGGEVWEMVGQGARGLVYRLKGSRPTDMLQAIENAMAGQVSFDPEVLTGQQSLAQELLSRLSPEERPWVERAVSYLDQLTPRERDIARRLAASHNTQGIAAALGITQKTVENHISHTYSKLGLSEITANSAQLRKVLILAKACMIKEMLEGWR